MCRKILFAMLATTLALFVAMESGLGQDKKPDIRGIVKTVSPSKKGGEIGFLLVEGPKGQTYDKASIRVTADTKIFKLDGADRKPATLKDLKVGQTVEAKFVGPIAESYPVQAKAGEIVIVSEEKK